MDIKVYKIYIDGACPGNGTDEAVGGMGFAQENVRPVSVPYTDHMLQRYGIPTNQKTELLAALIAVATLCQALKEDEEFAIQAKAKLIIIEVYSDSKYVVDGINIWLHNWKANGWYNSKKQPIANLQMWKDIDAILSYGDHRGLFSFFHVAGHSGNKLNDQADEAAVYATSNNRGDENHLMLSMTSDDWSSFLEMLASCYGIQF